MTTPQWNDPAPEFPQPDEWHVADAESGIYARQLGPNNYQLRYTDGSVKHMTAAEFDLWRNREVTDD